MLFSSSLRCHIPVPTNSKPTAAALYRPKRLRVHVLAGCKCHDPLSTLVLRNLAGSKSFFKLTEAQVGLQCTASGLNFRFPPGCGCERASRCRPADFGWNSAYSLDSEVGSQESAAPCLCPVRQYCRMQPFLQHPPIPVDWEYANIPAVLRFSCLS